MRVEGELASGERKRAAGCLGAAVSLAVIVVALLVILLSRPDRDYCGNGDHSNPCNDAIGALTLGVLFAVEGCIGLGYSLYRIYRARGAGVVPGSRGEG